MVLNNILLIYSFLSINWVRSLLVAAYCAVYLYATHMSLQCENDSTGGAVMLLLLHCSFFTLLYQAFMWAERSHASLSNSQEGSNSYHRYRRGDRLDEGAAPHYMDPLTDFSDSRGLLEPLNSYNDVNPSAEAPLPFSSFSSLETTSPNRATDFSITVPPHAYDDAPRTASLGRSIDIEGATAGFSAEYHTAEHVVHLQPRLSSSEIEVKQKERECGILQRQVEELRRDASHLREKNKRLNLRMWADRQYFAQYSKIFFSAQESGMRREMEKEEKQVWAELMLYHISACRKAELRGGKDWLSQFHHSSRDMSLTEDTTSLGGAVSAHNNKCTNSPNKRSKRGESLSVSPRRHATPSPVPPRENSFRQSPDSRQGNLNANCDSSSRIAEIMQKESEAEKTMEEQRIRIASLEKQIDLLEKQRLTTSNELACERTLTVEMQEEIDDLILTEVALREEARRAEIERSWYEEINSVTRRSLRSIIQTAAKSSPKMTADVTASIPKLEDTCAEAMRRVLKEEWQGLWHSTITPSLAATQDSIQTLRRDISCQLSTVLENSSSLTSRTEKIRESIQKMMEAVNSTSALQQTTVDKILTGNASKSPSMSSDFSKLLNTVEEIARGNADVYEELRQLRASRSGAREVLEHTSAQRNAVQISTPPLPEAERQKEAQLNSFYWSKSGAATSAAQSSATSEGQRGCATPMIPSNSHDWDESTSSTDVSHEEID